jgi:branched-subunit amino acid aminotransferase/4-amino-4-deoxychorismate lyase
VLEGPTFSVGWISNGVLFTPGLDLGILESITRCTAIEVAERVGIEVREGVYDIGMVNAADEVMAMSTVREIKGISHIDDRLFQPGPGTAALQEGFRAMVAEEVGS